FAGEPRGRGFRQRRMRLPNETEILWGVALPLLRHDLLIAFHQRVFRPMSAACGVVANHGLVHDDTQFRLGFELLLRLLRVLWFCAHAISASPRITFPLSITVRMIAASAAP